MVVRKVTERIHAIGAIDWNRRIFDELVHLPQGTSYNAYILKGSEKTLLIDTVDPSFEEEFITNLIKMGCDRIDAVVINHAEQDHSGSLPIILELFPGAMVYCTEKCKELLRSLLDIPPERIKTIKSGEILDIGEISLEFIEAPWVHWPETMLAYCPEEQVLFSCDLFGSHFASSSLFMNDPCLTEIVAKRYYAEIMMPFRNSIRQYLEKLAGMNISVIAPSHGPVFKPASWIMDKYTRWTGDTVTNTVLIPYVSMHGSTERMVRLLTEMLIERGINVKPFKLTGSDRGLLSMELVEAATVIFATPTVLFGPHPEMISTVYVANLLKPKTHYVSIIGSYGWGGKTVETISSMISHIKAEMIQPVYILGAPDEKARRDLERLADTIAEKHLSDPAIPR